VLYVGKGLLDLLTIFTIIFYFPLKFLSVFTTFSFFKLLRYGLKAWLNYLPPER